MQKRLFLVTAAVAFLTTAQGVSAQGAPVMERSQPVAASHPVPAGPSPIKDEHVKLVKGASTAHYHGPLPPQEPPPRTGRGGLQSAERAAAPGSLAATDASIQFLTRPYTTWHTITSAFDHCNPDYTTDGKVCRFEGTVGYRSYGADPSFSLGYAQSPGGRDYLYYDGHNGWDYALAYENVLASADGVVRLAGTDSINTCFGQTITIDHLNGYTTRYAHLARIYVSPGQSVTRGQVIAQSGNTGCSSGAHLHFGVYITSSWTAVDPWGWEGAGADPWSADPGNLWLTGYAQFPLPSAPTNVVAIPGVEMAYVSWSPPSFNGGNSITNYTVTVSPGGAVVTVPGSQTDALFGGLTNGTPYTFTVTAINSVASGASAATSSAVTPNAASSFYFGEGFTGPGFTETLSILSPNQSGVATIDYYTGSGRSSTVANFTAGKVTDVDVNAGVGANNSVSARVTLPVPGVVERRLHFNNGTWHGSTDQVGATAPAAEWDFAEGSTLAQFNEYLTLQNPNASAVSVNLNYFTDSGAHPVKSLSLPADSRTTVEVFRGDPVSSVASCVPGGSTGSCGVGRNVGGVSVQVKATNGSIVVERPFYVNHYNFGAGAITDGHVAFGANAASTQWYFAEGTTLPGFNEYLAIQNPGGAAANVTLTYFDGAGTRTVRSVQVLPRSRFTAQVFESAYGVGRNVAAVSAQVTADQPIVVERPMYVVRDFGSGTVAGATVVVGTNAPAKLFGFSAGSTVSTNHEFVTIQNPGGTAANVSATYYTNSGPIQKTFVVGAGSRYTVDLTRTTDGPGTGFTSVGIVFSADQPIVVEKATYDSGASTYGATDTLGASPASF